jgi:hypothetical protein
MHMTQGTDESNNPRRKPQRQMLPVEGYRGHHPHYVHRGVLIRPQIRALTTGERRKLQKENWDKYFDHPRQKADGFTVELEFDDSPNPINEKKRFPFKSAIQAVEYIDSHFDKGAAAKEGRLFTQRRNVV